MSHGFLSIFSLRLRQLMVLEISSFLPFRAYFGFEYLGELLLSQTILLVAELVPVEIQKIRVVHPVIPVFEHKLVAKLTDTIIERSNLVFLPQKFRSCLTEQIIFIAFKEKIFPDLTGTRV